MMKHFVFLGAEGVPYAAGCNRIVPEAAIELPPGISAEQAMNMMWTGEAWQARPQILDPTVSDDEGFPVLEFADLPDGAICEVIDRDTGGSLVHLEPDAEGNLMLTLGEAGPFRVEVTAPLPFMPYFLEVDVT